MFVEETRVAARPRRSCGTKHVSSPAAPAAAVAAAPQCRRPAAFQPAPARLDGLCPCPDLAACFHRRPESLRGCPSQPPLPPSLGRPRDAAHNKASGHACVRPPLADHRHLDVLRGSQPRREEVAESHLRRQLAVAGFKGRLSGGAADERLARRSAIPDPADVVDRATARPRPSLWERRPADSDFLSLRVGVGSISVIDARRV